MDYDEYSNKDRYSLRIDFEGKIPQKTKELLYEVLNEEHGDLCRTLGLEGSFGETKPIILPRDIVESI